MTAEARPPTGPAACRAFLRALPDFVPPGIAKGRPADLPEHLRTCATCRERFERAASVALRLAEAPAAADRIDDARLLEAVYERVSDRAAARPEVAEVLEALATPHDLPAEAPWPLQELPDGLGEVFGAETGQLVPSWLWRRTRHHVLEVVAARRRVRRRVRRGAFVAAAAVLIAAAGWNLAQSNGTSDGPEIVFVEVTEMPSVPHPFAALRPEGS